MQFRNTWVPAHRAAVRGFVQGRLRTPALLLTLGLAAGCSPDAPPGPALEQVLELQRSAIVIDTHSDTTPWFEDPDWDFSARHTQGHMDLPRIREGGLDAQFWSIYMGKTEGEGRAIRQAIEQIDAVHQMVARHADQVEQAYTAADIRRIARAGKLASLIGLEGGHMIEDSLSALRTFYRLGVRYMTLTHSFNTNWADSSGTNEVPEPTHGGLTDFGREVVREMNRLGMMVDVSHVSDDTFWDVLEVSEAPPLASHSSARAIADHPRNMSDDMLRALGDRGGVIMINFYSGYIDTSLVEASRRNFQTLRAPIELLRDELDGDPFGLRRAIAELYAENPFPQAPLAVLLDHFDHAIRVAGPDHVGLGSDWDGVPSMPTGLEDVSKLPRLTQGLLQRGHSRATLVKLLGANLLRVMEETEGVARRLRHAGDS
ncbi:MAG: membrane dipeptidase [Myxococcales bacterium]|nr:membrane dipeptidase [Myxococcales bacterium]